MSKQEQNNDPKNYVLVNASIGNIDEDYHTFRKIDEAYMIMECKYSSTHYMTSDSNFFDECKKRIQNQSKDNPYKIDIDTLCEFEETDLETMKRVFQVNQIGSKDKSVYQRVQHYGGAEEGGWWYHTLELTDYNPDSIEEGRNQYGEGYEIRDEFYEGEFENLEKQYYC